jgi:hypothetical protein
VEALVYQHRVAATSRPASVRGVVKPDPGLADAVSGRETVLFFSRAVSGPCRMANEFPIDCALDDSMGMTTGFKLPESDDAIAGSRLSADGEASASTGGHEGRSAVVSVNSLPEIVITFDHPVLTRAFAPAGEG